MHLLAACPPQGRCSPAGLQHRTYWLTQPTCHHICVGPAPVDPFAVPAMVPLPPPLPEFLRPQLIQLLHQPSPKEGASGMGAVQATCVPRVSTGPEVACSGMGVLAGVAAMPNPSLQAASPRTANPEGFSTASRKVDRELHAAAEAKAAAEVSAQPSSWAPARYLQGNCCICTGPWCDACDDCCQPCNLDFCPQLG